MKNIIFGLSGLELTEHEIKLFKETEIYGFILFKRNIGSKNQVLDLVSSLKAIYPTRDVPIFIDQEGGRVARIKPPIMEKEYPPLELFGTLYNSDPDSALAAAKANHLNLMRELKSLNIDCACSPVADLRFAYTDNVIGDRSFGGEVEKVVKLCNASIEGIKKAEGLAIIKHIPGHGRATCDSHLSLPRVSASLEELNATDFEVFRQLSKNEKIDFAMTAHIIYDALDPDLPATLSSKAIKFIREDIGFKGVLMSDDICMKALHVNINYEIKEKYVENLRQVAKQSLEAGCDIVLHCSGDIEEMKAVITI